VASNELLWDNTRQNKMRFREDLYHRFNEFTITVPPLRERKEDIPIFAQHFLKLTNAELGKNVKGFTPEVDDIFRNYIWYGNLRELKNVIKRVVLLTDSEYIEARSLPFEISNFSKLLFQSDPAALPNRLTDAYPATGWHMPLPPAASNVPETIKGVGIDAEYELIVKVLKEVKFNKTKAAKILNIDRKTLYNKLNEYKILNGR
jgi:two-component system response regulator HydG